MNKLAVFLISFIFLGFTALAPQAVAAEQESVGQAFIKAYDKKDQAGMAEVIKSRASEVPDEIKEMVGYAVSPDVKPEDQDFIFNIAGTMSKIYADQTKDDRLLGAVRQNYQSVLEKRKGGGGAPKDGVSISQESLDKAKKELSDLGKGEWRVVTFKVDGEGNLDAEVDVKELTKGEDLTPKIDMATAKKAKDIIDKALPKVRGGKILWTSSGVGLKTVFLTGGADGDAGKDAKKEDAKPKKKHK